MNEQERIFSFFFTAVDRFCSYKIFVEKINTFKETNESSNEWNLSIPSTRRVLEQSVSKETKINYEIRKRNTLQHPPTIPWRES